VNTALRISVDKIAFTIFGNCFRQNVLLYIMNNLKRLNVGLFHLEWRQN
jgi:hypothetical protein